STARTWVNCASPPGLALIHCSRIWSSVAGDMVSAMIVEATSANRNRNTPLIQPKCAPFTALSCAPVRMRYKYTAKNPLAIQVIKTKGPSGSEKNAAIAAGKAARNTNGFPRLMGGGSGAACGCAAGGGGGGGCSSLSSGSSRCGLPHL